MKITIYSSPELFQQCIPYALNGKILIDPGLNKFIFNSVLKDGGSGFIFEFDFIDQEDCIMTIEQFDQFIEELVPRIENLKAFL